MKDTKGNQYLGTAGEFRVMSELLLRGFNGAKSYLDHGIDVILEDGKKIQVKTATRFKNKYNNSTLYHFAIGGWHSKKDGTKKKRISVPVDFYIFWCVEDNAFFIIPAPEVTGMLGEKTSFQIDLFPNSFGRSPNGGKLFKRNRSKWGKYKEAWELLK